MKVQYYTAVSLDGYIADASHSLDSLFQFGEGDEIEQGGYPDFIRDVGAVVMGSTTYAWVLRNHVFPDRSDPKPWPYDQPSWVFTSRTLETTPGADIRFTGGSVADAFEAIRESAGGRNVWVAGGGDLAGQFHEAGLLDEMILTIAPVILCEGAPLLTRRIDRPPLRVVHSRTGASGMTQMRLEVPRRSRDAG